MKVVAEGLRFPEGPVAMPDGSVVLVEMFGQRVTRVHPDGSQSTVAEVPLKVWMPTLENGAMVVLSFTI